MTALAAEPRIPAAARPGPSGPVLGLLRCSWCSTALFRTRLLCPTCGGTRLARCFSTGSGRVYGWTRATAKGHPEREIAVVELDEGIRLNARVAGVLPGAAPIGTRVRLLLAPADNHTLPVFAVEEPAPPAPARRAAPGRDLRPRVPSAHPSTAR